MNDKINKINYKKITINSKYKKKMLSSLPPIFKKILLSEKIYLVIADKGYPPFGGGENWLMDTLEYFLINGYQSIMINFYDNNNKQFDETNVIKINDITIIQLSPFDTDILIKVIKYIKPKCISHQGSNRMYYLQLSNLLNIPFITGFCFWQDILIFDRDYINIDILDNDSIMKSLTFDTIFNDSYYIYASSHFVNKVIKKLHDCEIDIVNTTSKISNVCEYNSKNRKYITIVNIHYYKGGWLIPKLLTKLKKECEILLINTENNSKEYDEEIKRCIEERNNKFVKKTILIENKIDNIQEIYNDTKLLLIPSYVDESFCRVAYEGLINKIPIISTTQGNLKYLLNNYADFIEKDKHDNWINHINNIIDNNNYLMKMSSRTTSYDLSNDLSKLLNIVENIDTVKKNKFKFFKKHIGLLVPWADQGLGVQAREYYIQLKKNGYRPCVMSFKPYSSCDENKLFQTNVEEWKYDNVYYYDVFRENIELHHIVDFIRKTGISKIIIPEICYAPIFKISSLFKLLKVGVFVIPNIEIIRYDELCNYTIFDKIFCNNDFTFNFFKQLKIEAHYLGFKMCHPYLKMNVKREKSDKIEFYCSGGLNAIKRKHIDVICETFKNIKYNNAKLFVYIQGVEIPNIDVSDNVEIIVKNQTYRDIIKMHKSHDVFIHFGSHEGLGLGLYEALQSHTPVITIDTPPNNEVINPCNGWLIKSSKFVIKDNNCSCILGDLFNKEHFIKTIEYICETNDHIEKKNNIALFQPNEYINNLIKHL